MLQLFAAVYEVGGLDTAVQRYLWSCLPMMVDAQASVAAMWGACSTLNEASAPEK